MSVNATLPGLSAGEVAGVTQMPLSTYCLVYALSGANGPGTYTRAFAVVRAELSAAADGEADDSAGSWPESR